MHHTLHDIGAAQQSAKFAELFNGHAACSQRHDAQHAALATEAEEGWLPRGSPAGLDTLHLASRSHETRVPCSPSNESSLYR